MKKVLSLILVLCMVFSAVSFVIPAGAVTYGYVKGDADDSTTVNTKDVLVLRKYLGGAVTIKD
ncbi:MAG: hypothetical protein E7660_04540, partial [Ruminococcaceae bacterium]|nr:hypothetical protein [Oscillospiraceae bacterium]